MTGLTPLLRRNLLLSQREVFGATAHLCGVYNLGTQGAEGDAQEGHGQHRAMDLRGPSRIKDGQAYTSNTGRHAGNKSEGGEDCLPPRVLDAIVAWMVPDMMSGKYGTGICNGGDSAADDKERFEMICANVGDEATRAISLQSMPCP